MREGWKGWDEYAPFYDWENARTLGRRDVAYWRRLASKAGGRVLELGCGTGRISISVAAAGVNLVGVDRSAAMLKRIPRHQSRSQPTPNPPSLVPRLVRADIRDLPFRANTFAMAIAPYGILQSLIRPRDLTATLASVSRVLAKGATFAIDLVPDVPRWREYRNRVRFRGRAGSAHLTLIESVRQDRARHVTTFEQRYLERRDGQETEHRFDLTFRTLSVVQMTRHLERAGFRVDACYGDYRGGAWSARAGVWIIVAEKR